MGSISPLQDHDSLSQEHENVPELTFLAEQWQISTEAPAFAILMASSEVDQKFLGHFATVTRHANSFLSSMLFKILGLSVILSKKLVRARKLRRLDPTRETKSLQLYHHILWLSREGLVIVEQYVLPMVTEYVELKVLAYKLQASFYHIFVLFHNQPTIHQPGIQSLPPSTSNLHLPSNGTHGVAPAKSENSPGSPSSPNRGSIAASPTNVTPEGGPVGGTRGPQNLPPGLGPAQPPVFASSFILPALDYTPTATACFTQVASLAGQVLPGSHPIRLSVKLEYCAYLYDCLHDTDSCRRLAKQAIADVYNAEEGMDDESFEDAAELVSILGKMVKRGGKSSSGGGSSAGGGGGGSRSDGSRSTPTRSGGGDVSITPRVHHQQQQHQHTPQRSPGKKPPPTKAAHPSPGGHHGFPGPSTANQI